MARPDFTIKEPGREAELGAGLSFCPRQAALVSVCVPWKHGWGFHRRWNVKGPGAEGSAGMSPDTHGRWVTMPPH